MGLIVLLLIEKPKRRQQSFDRPNLQVAQEILTLLLLFIIIIIVVILLFYIVVVFILEIKK